MEQCPKKSSNNYVQPIHDLRVFHIYYTTALILTLYSSITFELIYEQKFNNNARYLSILITETVSSFRKEAFMVHHLALDFCKASTRSILLELDVKDKSEPPFLQLSLADNVLVKVSYILDG